MAFTAERRVGGDRLGPVRAHRLDTVVVVDDAIDEPERDARAAEGGLRRGSRLAALASDEAGQVHRCRTLPGMIPALANPGKKVVPLANPEVAAGARFEAVSPRRRVIAQRDGAVSSRGGRTVGRCACRGA